MPDMLTMSTFQVRHPIALVISMKSYYSISHDSSLYISFVFPRAALLRNPGFTCKNATLC